MKTMNCCSDVMEPIEASSCCTPKDTAAPAAPAMRTSGCHLFVASLVAFSFVILFSSSGFAQHDGHGGFEWPGGQSTQTMAGEQMQPNVDSMMRNIASMLRDLSAMPMASGQYDQLLIGMNGILGQMWVVHRNLSTMMSDPMLMQQGDATKAVNKARRDLEKMASAFQSMTKNVDQAMKGLHHGER